MSDIRIDNKFVKVTTESGDLHINSYIESARVETNQPIEQSDNLNNMPVSDLPILPNVGGWCAKDVIYNYITSQEFAMHIKAVVSAYKQMQEDLGSEKRSMQRIWKKRETQIQKVMGNVTDIYATIEGLVGSQKVLPEIEPLSLEAVADDQPPSDS